MKIHFPFKTDEELIAYCGEPIYDNFSRDENNINCERCNEHIKSQYSTEKILNRFKNKKPLRHQNYTPDIYGVWAVFGDVGPDCQTPFLGCFEGTFEQVLEHAVSIKEFCTHHTSCGGTIEKVNITKL